MTFVHREHSLWSLFVRRGSGRALLLRAEPFPGGVSLCYRLLPEGDRSETPTYSPLVPPYLKKMFKFIIKLFSICKRTFFIFPQHPSVQVRMWVLSTPCFSYKGVLRIRPHRNEDLCHSRRGTIKIPSRSKVVIAEKRPKLCSSSPAIVTFLYARKIIERVV